MQNVTSIDEAKKEAIADEAMECADIVMQAVLRMEEATARLAAVRQKATDMVVKNEATKREFIASCDSMIDQARAATSLLAHGAMPATEFRDELLGMLLLRDGGLLKEVLTERCNNVAQAYQGRIVREAGK